MNKVAWYERMTVIGVGTDENPAFRAWFCDHAHPTVREAAVCGGSWLIELAVADWQQAEPGTYGALIREHFPEKVTDRPPAPRSEAEVDG